MNTTDSIRNFVACDSIRLGSASQPLPLLLVSFGMEKRVSPKGIQHTACIRNVLDFESGRSEDSGCLCGLRPFQEIGEMDHPAEPLLSVMGTMLVI